MGNKIGRRRQVVDEKYTRPQGLYQHRDIDQKKLRKLILDSKLAPCYLGEEDLAIDLEECPICFLYYPSLNRSRCCMKGICTECFLQMKPHHSTRPTQCPFCKTSNYAVEYRGMRTKEEKGMEQLEEQKVIEAQIRMRQQELQDEEERMLKRQEASSASRIVTPVDADIRGVSNNTLSVPSFRYSTHGDEFVSPQTSCSVPASRGPSHSRQNREDNFDLDLEEIMVMEAIWLSIQEQGSTKNPACGGSSLLGPSSSEDCYDSHAITPVETSSGGLACAVAALAEHQHMNGDPANVASTSAPVFNMLQQSGCIPAGEGRMVRNYPPESWIEISPDNGRAVPREDGEWTTSDNGRSVPREEGEWTTPENGITVSREEGEWARDYGSEMAEAGNSYTNSEVSMDAGAAALPLPEGVSMATGHILPESFEEQMMLAMAVSLAEARARTSTPGLTWL